MCDIVSLRALSVTYSRNKYSLPCCGAWDSSPSSDNKLALTCSTGEQGIILLLAIRYVYGNNMESSSVVNLIKNTAYQSVLSVHTKSKTAKKWLTSTQIPFSSAKYAQWSRSHNVAAVLELILSSSVYMVQAFWSEFTWCLVFLIKFDTEEWVVV